jgi:NAD(P)-dependent dehydrogenase (short-subunit alcohol dehydrogenase family)
MPDSPVVLITGSNKGIGYEAARQMLARGCTVWVTARDPERGQKALRTLSGDVRFLPLDVGDEASVLRAAQAFAVASPKLDVLVNNAAILLDRDESLFDLDLSIVRQTFETNVFGPLRVSQAFAPFLRASARPRIINLSSGGGQLSEPSTWAPAYCLSKTAVNGVTVQLAASLPNAAVNSVCPGWVRTDMGGAGADRSVAQGAETIVWLALDAPQTLTGKFLRDRVPIPW